MRGLGKATVHCLLSATAFNLKRMVRLLIQPLLFLAYLPYSLLDMLFRCLCWQFVNSTDSEPCAGHDQSGQEERENHCRVAAPQ